MAIDYTSIGQRIQNKRKALKKTQENMAEALSVTVGYVSQIERGITKVNLETLSAISDYLGTDISELITGASTNSSAYLSAEFKKSFNALSPQGKKTLIEISSILLKNQ